MIVLMVFAAVVSVAQLTILGSGSRTLRIGTLLQAVGVGFLVCAPVTVCFQWLLTRGVALVTGADLRGVVDLAAWTYDPFIEEVVKLLPPVLLAWRFRRLHAQFGWVDHLLAGAALGTGFALCEAALRFARLGASSFAVDGGYVVAVSLFGVAVVPSLWTSLTSWQPQPVQVQEFLAAGDTAIQHLVWTGLAALGLVWLVRGHRLRWLGLIPLALVTLDHCTGNAEAGLAVPSWLTAPLSRLGALLPAVLVLCLVAATVVDRLQLGRERARRPGLLLPGERADGLDPRPVLAAAFHGFPFSTFSTWHVVLERRAALNAAALGVAAPELADRALTSVSMLTRASDAERWAAAGRAMLAAVNWRALLGWRMILWLVAISPRWSTSSSAASRRPAPSRAG